MFWIRRKKSPITQDVESFAITRKQFVTTSNQIVHINRFIKCLGIETFSQITEEDINSYIASLRYSITRESERIQIAQSLFLFMQYKRIKDKRENCKQIGRPKKIERNQRIIELRNKEKYSYRDLAQRFNLDVRTVYTIIKRGS